MKAGHSPICEDLSLVGEGEKRINPLKVVCFKYCASLEGVLETNSFDEII